MSDPGRSFRQWIGRGALAITAATIGWFSLSDTLANVVVKSSPSTAQAMAPWDGVIAASLAQAEMSTEPTSDDQSHVARLARQAITLDPTAVDALEVLGLQAQLRSETEKARNIFNQSLALSRRELRPRVWAIEEAVSRGDIVGALDQYDIALRTSRRAPDILFPVLASAIAEPKVRSALVTRLASNPDWGKRFITYASRGRPDPVAVASFFIDGQAVGLPIEDADRTALVNAMAARGQIESAWNYYKTFRNAHDDRSRNPRFETIIEKPAVFDWETRNSPGISSSIQRGDRGGMVDFSAAPSVGGVVLDQRQFLRSGEYSFESTIEGLEQPERSRPYWTLTCQGGGKLGRILVPNSKEAHVKFKGRFTVPSGCGAQTLALVVRPSDEIAGVSGRVYRAEIRPVETGALQKGAND